MGSLVLVSGLPGLPVVSRLGRESTSTLPPHNLRPHCLFPSLPCYILQFTSDSLIASCPSAARLCLLQEPPIGLAQLASSQRSILVITSDRLTACRTFENRLHPGRHCQREFLPQRRLWQDHDTLPCNRAEINATYRQTDSFSSFIPSFFLPSAGQNPATGFQILNSKNTSRWPT